MELLQKHGLSLKPEKCEFEKTSIEYLGVVVSHDSVKMDPAKVAGVSEWPTPSNKKEVQSFLGFTNFYRRFIEGFSHIARPLFSLTKGDSVFKWSFEEKLAFNTLKDKITSAPILALPDNSRPYCVESDSSDFAMGAVLSQKNPEDDKWHPITFLSKSVRGHPPNPVSLMKSDNPAPTSIPTPYVPPHRQVHFKDLIVT